MAICTNSSLPSLLASRQSCVPSHVTTVTVTVASGLLHHAQIWSSDKSQDLLHLQRQPKGTSFQNESQCLSDNDRKITKSVLSVWL